MKRLWKTVSILLSACLLAAAFAGTALAAKDDDEDLYIGSVWWDEDNGGVRAAWDNEDGISCKVQLYRGNPLKSNGRFDSSHKVGTQKSTKKDYVDFTAEIVNKGTGSYYFVIYPKTQATNYTISERLTVDSDYMADLKSHLAYKHSEAAGSSSGTGGAAGPGEAAASGGWSQSGGVWRYYENSAAVASDWRYINDKWYYFGADGAMLTGWQAIGGAWYYLTVSADAAHPEGSMYCSETTPDGYTVNGSGAWVVDGAVQPAA